ncbi:hypothetical protein HZA33_02350 [Candidatus Pacearchaeota archaeon]|nr:hypothetical protein [Candidatus Pacearchaeota archaeon]
MKLEDLMYKRLEESPERYSEGVEALYFRLSTASSQKLVELEDILSRNLPEASIYRKPILKRNTSGARRITEETYHGFVRNWIGQGTPYYAVIERCKIEGTDESNVSCYLTFPGQKEITILKQIVERLKPEMSPEIMQIYEELTNLK